MALPAPLLLLHPPTTTKSKSIVKMMEDNEDDLLPPVIDENDDDDHEEEEEDNMVAVLDKLLDDHDDGSTSSSSVDDNNDDDNERTVRAHQPKGDDNDDERDLAPAPIYGGLENLGNTCYMASALQMLASAEGFVESLLDSSSSSIDNDDDDNDETTTTTTPPPLLLRSAFGAVMQNLRRQRVVRPEMLKQAIDERSTLFLGYRQQDSNELLITLLDLLDEEYKQKKTKKQQAKLTNGAAEEAQEESISPIIAEDDDQEGNETTKMMEASNKSLSCCASEDFMDAETEPECCSFVDDLAQRTRPSLAVVPAACPRNDEKHEDERSTVTTVVDADILDDDDDDNDHITVATQTTSASSRSDDTTVSDEDQEDDQEDEFHSAQVVPMEEEHDYSEASSSSSSSSHEVAMSMTKKARLSDDEQQPTTTSTTTTAPTIDSLNPWRSSFSSFTLEDIGRLLHGDPSDALILPDVSTTCLGNEPQYKLVGGRMNTTDVVLQPYMAADYNNNNENSSSASETNNNNNKGSRMCTTTTVVEPSSSNLHNESTAASTHNNASDDEDDPKITTPIDSYFKTSVRVKLTCDSCKYTRHHVETFWQLSLEIGSDHLEDALRRFFAPCRQEIKCEKCFCDTATQTMEIEELPPYLLLHFKRFIVHVSSDYSSISYKKDGSPVYFHDRLSLSDHDYYYYNNHHTNHVDDEESHLLLDSEETTTNNLAPDYRLISVVNHIGQSASCGHYTADAQRTAGAWQRFNDAYVSNITAQQAIEESRHTAYMVLYRLEPPTTMTTTGTATT